MIVTYCVLLLARELTRGLEVHTDKSEVAFLILDDVLDRIDVEGHGEPVDRKDNGLGLAVDEYLRCVLMESNCTEETKKIYP